jgi:hypothetical protein
VAVPFHVYSSHIGIEIRGDFRPVAVGAHSLGRRALGPGHHAKGIPKPGFKIHRGFRQAIAGVIGRESGAEG